MGDMASRDVFEDEDGKSINPKSLVQLSKDLEQLLDPETSHLADVRLKCGSVSIPAHRIILSARSPVFAAMFKNSMKENRGNKVDITDVDASVLQALVIYMYTGKAQNLTVTSASGLLFAADKYQLQDLKSVCCDFLMDNISLENVFMILILGDNHAEDLKLAAMHYIGYKFDDLEKTEEWKTVRKERPALAMDVLTSLVKFKDQPFSNIRFESPPPYRLSFSFSNEKDEGEVKICNEFFK